MRTKSALIVMMIPVVIATGCAHAPVHSSATAVSTSNVVASEEGGSLAAQEEKTVLDVAESDYLSDSQGLVSVGLLDKVDDAITEQLAAHNQNIPAIGGDGIQSLGKAGELTSLVNAEIDHQRSPHADSSQPNTIEQPVRLAFDEGRSLLSDEVDAQASRSVPPAEAAKSEIVPTGLHLLGNDLSLQRECIDLGLGSIVTVIDPCGLSYLAPYLDRVPLYDQSQSQAPRESVNAALACPPPAWWESDVTEQARPESNAIRIDLESLLVRTLANSKFLQGLADLPLIREKSTLEAMAEFDVKTFTESRFRRPSEPVGNQLTIGPGGSQRLRENDFTSSAGIARKTTTGGQVLLAQEVGLFTNNSTFIDPRHQGNSRLTLNLTQPLLSGSGKAYNTSLIMLAQMDQRVAWDDVSEQLQDYLVDVTETYWQLYLERSRLTQKIRHLQRGEVILAELEQRREVDAVENQIARARAAVQTRRSELIRAKTTVRNTESRLRGLVNDPELYGSTIEVVPAEIPQCAAINLSLRDAMAQALQSRAEIDKAIQKVRAASVRLSVAKNELLPILDLVMETYLSGLRGSNDIGRAWVDQFSVGEPSYSAGIRYEIPWNNRMAKNRHERRRLEMRQAISQFEYNVEELMSEVEIAVREVNTTYDELLSRFESMSANEVDLNYFYKRWELLPGDSRSASFLLEDILEAQDRVAAEESNFAQAQVNYAMSIVNVKRAIGILLQSESIETGRTGSCELDRYIFSKMQNAATPDDLTTSHDSHSQPAQVMADQESMPLLPRPGQELSLLESEPIEPTLHDSDTSPHPFSAPVAVENLGLTPGLAPAAATGN